MGLIADGFQVPKDLPGLCYWMADIIRAMPTPDEELQFIAYSCAVQRLEQLGILEAFAGEVEYRSWMDSLTH